MDELNALAKRELELARRAFDPLEADRARVRRFLSGALAMQVAPRVLHDAKAASTGSSTSATGAGGLRKELGKASRIAWLRGVLLFGLGTAVGFALGFTVAGEKATDGIAASQVEGGRAVSASLEVPRTKAPPAVSAERSEIDAPTAKRLESSGASGGFVTEGVKKLRDQKLGVGPTEPSVSPNELGAADRELGLAADEVLQIERVQRALRDGYPELALGILRSLDGAVPRGQLMEERAAARVIAGCALGTGTEAEARQFARSYPSSLYLGRIAEQCEPEHARPRVNGQPEEPNGSRDRVRILRPETNPGQRNPPDPVIHP